MGHPAIENETPFALQPLFVADEEGRPLVAPIVKATFDLPPGAEPLVADEQRPVDFAGEYHGEPGESSYRYEPETAFVKPGTDVVLIGHAHAPEPKATRVEVHFRAGPLKKVLLVSGDRTWTTGAIGLRQMTPPEPFERIPLVYERSYGGWDRTHADPDRHAFDVRNPVGMGFARRGRFPEGTPVPNIEDPFDPVRSRTGLVPKPTGFGFTCPHWEPRRLLAGTYDRAWSETRAPLLPRDFDRWFFQGGSVGLVAGTHFRGDERVRVENASPRGREGFDLPGVPPPVVTVALRAGGDRTLQTCLDTVIVDMDDRRLTLLWRAHLLLRDGPLDVAALRVAIPDAPQAVRSRPAMTAS